MDVLGIDIGGSGIKGALVDTSNGTLKTERLRIETPIPATPLAVAGKIMEMVAFFQWKGPMGCGFPAVIQHGVAKTAANVDPGWIDTHVENLFTESTGCKTTVINDADAAGLAEVTFGMGKNIPGLVLLLTVGTGIGSALFNNGVLVPNTEYGHLYYKDVVAEKYCADSVRKKYDMEWTEWARRFNNYLKHLERVINPDLFVIGGGISKKQEKFMPYLDLKTKIAIAELENNAGIIGAALAATKVG